MNKKSGFSLMELIIVIVIIGILIAAVIGMTGSKETAKIVATKSQIDNIKKATEEYMKSKGLNMYSTLGSNATATLQTFMGKPFPMNPWASPYTITGDAAGLHISTNLGSATVCNKIVTQVGDTASSSSCAGNVITVNYNEW